MTRSREREVTQESAAAVVESGVRAATPELAALDARVGRWPRPARIALLVSSDALALVTAAAVGYFSWGLPVRGQPAWIYASLLPLLPVVILAYAKWGLYPGFGLGAVETLRRLSLASSTVFLSLAALSFALKTPQLYSRATFVIAWVSALLLAPFFRYLLLAAVKQSRWWAERCVILGCGELAARTIRSLAGAHTLGFRPVACFETGTEPAPPERVEGVPVLPGAEGVPRAAAAGVRIALVADDGDAPTSLLALLQQDFRQVILLQERERLPIEGVAVRNLGGVLGLEFLNQALQRRNRILKRALDLTLGSVALLVSLPVILFAGLLVKLFSRGPIIYSQVREGLGGREFRLRKLRTMRADAESRLEAHLTENPEARREWERRFKLRNDPRLVPVVGRWLRRFSLDELPQLWNVVRGQMSLVGPRPLPGYHLERFPEEFRELRRRVRPGLTGLWQVMARSDGDVEEQMNNDSYYIHNWSLWMDLHVLARTVVAVLRGRGAY